MALSTKQRILDISIDLFSESGYAETSIRDIAKSVGIKTSSIYYHFESKEAILNNILSLFLEVVNYDKHYKKWQDEKDSILSGETQITVDKLLNYMFFYFDENTVSRNLKIIKIISNEAAKNETVSDYQKQMVLSGYNYIKDILDTLIASGKLKKHDTSGLATVLYSISFAYMHLEPINMHSVSGNEGEDMFTPLEYVLQMAFGDSLA